jgi:histidinol-phosphatase (PHP family)
LYLVDYHVHTKRCGHASGADREFVEAAIQKGLKEIGFSDHIPRFYEPDNGKRITERGMPRSDIDEYVDSVIKLKTEYQEILVKLGLEADYAPGWEEALLPLVESYPWDYISGAVHFIPEWDYGYISHYKDRDPAEIFAAYFNLVAAAAESKLFDILAHIDLPRRFFPRLSAPEMNELYQMLAIRLGKTGTIVELNTFGVRSSKQSDVGVFPDEPLLRFCRQQGLNVTIGSDAHSPKDVGADFDRATRLLTTVGYNRIVTFSSREPGLVKWQSENT